MSYVKDVFSTQTMNALLSGFHDVVHIYESGKSGLTSNNGAQYLFMLPAL